MSRADPLWLHDCRAYVVQADLGEECRTRLAAVQERLSGVLDGTVECPPASLHVTVAVLLSVRRDYPSSKDTLWELWGRHWGEELRYLADRLPRFELRFDRLEVSETAVIALAARVPVIDVFRRRAAVLQRAAGIASYQPSIVHCTLLRYARSGLELSELALVAAGARCRARSLVAHLTVRRERVYPNVVSDDLDRLLLGGGQPSPGHPPARSRAAGP